MNCPRCLAPLEVKIKDEVEVDSCARCEGIWVGHIDEKQVLQIKPETFTVDELKRLRKLYQPFERKERIQYLACPECKELMHRRNWGSHSGVIVDKCEEHGTWYDHGEVEKIQEFIAHGGIEFEKMRKVDKASQRLESKVDREVTRLSLKTDSVYRRARFWSIIGF